MDWIKNLISYCDTKNPGKCPKCESKNIEVTEHKIGRRTSWTFVCKECGQADHFDGITNRDQ